MKFVAARQSRNRNLRSIVILGSVIAGLSPALVAAQSVEETLATAYSSNPTLLGARARLRSVNEGVPQALSNWRPTVTVSGSVDKERTEIDNSLGSDNDTEESLAAEVELKQFLYRGGRTVAGTKQAEADVLAEREVLRSTEQLVLLDAVTSYMDVWRDQSVLRLNINNEQVLQRQLEASRDRFEVGEITRTDVAQSDSRLARATADRIAAEGNLTASRAVYQEVVGIYPGILEEPSQLGGLPANQEEVVAAAISNNPDLISAQFTEKSARHQVRVSIGELLPEAFVSGTINHTDERSSSGTDTDRYRVLAQVDIPIYQQGFVSSQVRENKQVANQRRIEIDEARRAAEQNGITAWEDLQTARAQIVSFEAEVASTGIALEGVRQENAVGARTILDILDAEQEMLDAQVSLVGAQRDAAVASYAVFSAMGRLTAANLGLPVEVYDPAGDYDAVRDKWFGLSAPND